MAEVTKFNFEDSFPEIEESIRNASFIALDAEFTGLRVGSADELSLFDSMEERYQKLKIRATSFMISQIGLSTFKRHESNNSYQVKTFVFYVRPYLCGGNIDKTFMCQASCLDFLCRFDFDFNKFFKEGVPFMNEAEVKQLTEELEEGKFHFPYNFLDREQDMLINDTLLRPDEKTKDRSSASQTPRKILKLPKDKQYPAYYQIIQLKNKYPTLSAHASEDEIIVEKGQSRKNSRYLREEKEKALNFSLGFTKVFRLLKDVRKPIVGHNFLMDLLLFFHNFHNPLPDSYKKFKEEMHSVFPVIFDTRQIWRNVKRFTVLKNIPPQCGLFELFEVFKNPPPALSTLYSPTLEPCNGNKYVDGQFPHESGYDSFVTGYVFLSICHLIAIKKAKNPIFIEPQTFKQHLSAVEPFVNKVNLSRSRYAFIDFGGNDPSPNVPEYLCVSKKSNDILNEQELAAIFSKHGVLDIRLLPDRRKAVIAVSTQGVFKEILSNFENHDVLTIRKFNRLKHSPILNRMLWLTALGSVCVVALLVVKLT